MELPRVTIITPSYNQAAYLEQTILSVLSQGYPNLEYMIVDGGSTDGSVEIIRKYADQLAWWVSEKDRGQAEAINKGFARATGELVGWLNSDDLFQPGSILAAVEGFRGHPEAGIVYGDVLSINAAGEPINLMRFAPYTLQDLMAFKIISQPGAMMRRAVLEQAGYLELRFHYMLDHHLWLRMVRLAPMVYLPRQQAAARFHPAAKNLAQAPKFGEEALQVAAWLAVQAEFAEHYHARKVWGGAYRVNGWYQVEGDRPAAALASYARSLINDPGAALADWRRIVYAGLSLLGFARLKGVYYAARQQIRRRTRPDIYGTGPDSHRNHPQGMD
jgi:glycosyltransferase involved in cell wall biosynthesis